MKHIEPATLPQVLPPDAEPVRQMLMDAASWLEGGNYQPNSAGCAIRAMVAISSRRTGLPDQGLVEAGRLLLRGFIKPECIPDWSDKSGCRIVAATLRRCALEG